MEAGPTRRERATKEKLSVQATRMKIIGSRRSENLSGTNFGATKRVSAATPEAMAVANEDSAAVRLSWIWTEPAALARRRPTTGIHGKM